MSWLGISYPFQGICYEMVLIIAKVGEVKAKIFGMFEIPTMSPNTQVQHNGQLMRLRGYAVLRIWVIVILYVTQMVNEL